MVKNFQNVSERDVSIMAKKIVADKEMLAQHLYKTQKCRHGLRCNRKENCVGSHFANEHRVNICLHLQYCNRAECTYYHPQLGSVEGYKVQAGISFEYNSKEEWLAATVKKPYPIVQKPYPIVQEKQVQEKPWGNSRRPQLFEEPSSKRQRTFSESHPDLAPIVKMTFASYLNSQGSQKDPRFHTRFCSKMTESSPCLYNGCTFAHSIDQIVVRECDKSGCMCKAVHKGEQKVKAVERIFGVVQDFIKRETRFNHAKEMAVHETKILADENLKELEENVDECEILSKMMAKTKIDEETKEEDDDEEDEAEDEEDINVIVNI